MCTVVTFKMLLNIVCFFHVSSCWYMIDIYFCIYVFWSYSGKICELNVILLCFYSDDRYFSFSGSGSVSVLHQAVSSAPVCHKLEFTVRNQEQLNIVLAELKEQEAGRTFKFNAARCFCFHCISYNIVGYFNIHCNWCILFIIFCHHPLIVSSDQTVTCTVWACSVWTRSWLVLSKFCQSTYWLVKVSTFFQPARYTSSLL